MIKHILATLVTYLIGYVIGSFVYVDFNLNNWEFDGRVFMAAISTAVAAIVYVINEKLT